MPSPNLKLTAPINMGLLNNNSNQPEASAAMMAGEPNQARMISASSSVISANSLGSSSTKASSRMNATMMCAPAGNSDAIKSLMKQISTGTDSTSGEAANKEDDAENTLPSASVVSNQASKSSSPSNSSSTSAAAAPDPAASSVMQMGAPPHPVAEFLFQLTKMLTDNNSEYIEWRNASIFVHDPPVSLLT